MKEQFTEDALRKLWGNGKSFTFRGKKYKVHKMSYGDYFLEPANFKARETDGFAPNTIWFEKINIKNQYGLNQIVYIPERSH